LAAGIFVDFDVALGVVDDLGVLVADGSGVSVGLGV
jgi:hypothetical protein